MTAKLTTGKSFLVPSGPSGFHLHVIVTNSCTNGMHLLIPISSIKAEKFYDPTCIILANEKAHPFIVKDSYAFYSKIQTRAGLQIENCVTEKSFIPRENFSKALLDRICNGIALSPFTPKWAKNQYKNWPN